MDSENTGQSGAHITHDGQTLSNATLMELVYDELRAMASRFLRYERPGHTLQATALVHEAYMRINAVTGIRWASRAHFFAFAAEAVRRVLVDYARRHKAAKRGGGRTRLRLSDDAVQAAEDNVDLLDLDDVLQELQSLHPRQSQIVEMRFFGGLTVDEVAQVLEVSPRTVYDDWTLAKAWLGRRLRHT